VRCVPTTQRAPTRNSRSRAKKVVNAVDYESALVSVRDAEDSRMLKHLQLLFLRKLPQRLQQSLRLMMYSVISVLPTHRSILWLD
jgi:hypothetical protein